MSNSILTDEQMRAVDSYMTARESDVDVGRDSKRELYDRLSTDPKFDACYKQAISEKLVQKGILEKKFESGYPDTDPDLVLARKYVRDTKPIEPDEPLPEPVVASQSPVYIKHVSKLIINFKQ